MKTSSFKQAIEAQFDCLSKKVIKRAVKKGYRDMKRREKHECLFSDIPDYEQSRFGELDKYESDYTVFNILGIEVYWSSFLVTLCSEIMLYIETPLVSYSYSLNEVSHSCTS